MELLSVFSTILSAIKKWGALILKKAGYKITASDDYQEEIVEVNASYPETSSACVNEKHNGAKFLWSVKYHPDYEKYFEISANKKLYFESRRRILWIKRKQD